MFAIEAIRSIPQPRRIVGMFSTRATAEAFLMSERSPAGQHWEIVEIPMTTYPVYVINDRLIEYGDIEFAKYRLSSLRKNGEEDFIHMILYVFHDDFPKPPRFEKDSIPHWHIDDDCLQPRNLDSLIEDIQIDWKAYYSNRHDD